MKSFFGRKKSATPQENPYAQDQPQEEYDRMTPYQRAGADSAYSPRPNVASGLPSGPGPRRDYNASPVPSSQSFGGSTYVGSQDQSYGPGRYGSNQGYGADRFDSNSTAFSSNHSVPPVRSGGYGGFAPAEPADTSELFAGANESSDPARYAKQPRQPTGERWESYSPGAGQESGGHEDVNEYKDLTPEQQEQRDFSEIQHKIKNERGYGNALRKRVIGQMTQANQVADNTLGNLYQQDERLNRTERNLDESAAHARQSEAKTKELQSLSGSIFNPSHHFTKKKRAAEQEQFYIESNRIARQDREATRREGYSNSQEYDSIVQKVNAQRGKYDLDGEISEAEEGDDSETEALRQEEKQDMEVMFDLTGQLKAKSLLMGDKLASSNRTIDRISGKTEGVSDNVVKNNAKLRSFK